MSRPALSIDRGYLKGASPTQAHPNLATGGRERPRRHGAGRAAEFAVVNGPRTPGARPIL